MGVELRLNRFRRALGRFSAGLAHWAVNSLSWAALGFIVGTDCVLRHPDVDWRNQTARVLAWGVYISVPVLILIGCVWLVVRLVPDRE
jgi:hypothetical protein